MSAAFAPQPLGSPAGQPCLRENALLLQPMGPRGAGGSGPCRGQLTAFSGPSQESLHSTCLI